MKTIVFKMLIYIGLFIAVIGAYAVFRYIRQPDVVSGTEGSSSLMGKATLPVLHTMVEDEIVNEIHGYTMDMDTSYMRQCVTVLSSEKTLDIEIDKFDSSITSISIEIHDLKGNVIERSSLDGWKTNKNKVTATYDCQEDINQGEEYLMIVKISTETVEAINYYSVLKYIPGAKVGNQIAFIKDYSDKTFDPAKSEELIPYIEPSPENPNNNLGNVDITSSFKQLTWAGMNIKRTSEAVVHVIDVSATAGCYQITYQAQEKNEDDVLETYNVTEFYRVCYNRDQLYLISHNRKMDQIYNTKSGNVSTKRMNIGIDSDLAVDVLSSDNTKYISFVRERQLFLMDTNRNEITNVFSFYDKSNNSVRDTFNNHNIQIVSIDDQGNVQFLVYGYMNRGEHEGKSGVTFYQYNKEENTVKEIIYFPIKKPYQLIKESVGKLCYVTEENMMYIYLDHNIYSVDIKNKEYVEAVSNIDMDAFVLNQKGYKIAWLENSDGVNNIRIKNLKTGEDQLVKGKKGTILVPLGFMNEDFVYGITKSKNILNDENNNKGTLLSTIKIVDHALKELKTYRKKGKLMTNVVVEDSIIKLETAIKVKQNGKTIYQIEGSDQILNNQDQAQQEVTVKTIVTEKRQTEVVINYVNHVISSESTKMLYPKEINTDGGNALELKVSANDDKNYYVYGKGQLLNISSNKQKAETEAKAVKGFVTDSTNTKVWDYVEKFAY